MHFSDVIRNSSADLEPNGRSTVIGASAFVWFSLFLLLGGVAALYPLFALCCLAALAMLGIAWATLRYIRSTGLELWQVLVLIALAGYLVLNYGFENLTLHVGAVPIIIGYALLYASLALAVLSRRHYIISAMKEPAMLCLVGLLVLTSLHLVFDFPSYGIWALRDASLFLDSIFLLLGLLWASKKGSTIPLLKGLFVIFLLNLVYAYTYPWNEQIQSWSPTSGVFVHVPILGRYHSTYVVLLAGALFCLGLGSYVVSWPRWAMVVLAVAQLFGLGIHTYRSTYISIAVILIVLTLLGELRKSAVLLSTLSLALVVLLLITSLGFTVSGRFGDVNAAFFEEHIRSLSGASDTPGSAIEARLDWYDQVSKVISSNLLLGVGFGEPLTNEINDENGQVIRQPHNSHISVLARLGALGLAIWLLFHFCIVKRYIRALRTRRSRDAQAFQIVLWFLLLYIILMIVASVQPGFEYPTGSVPFYFCTGFALGFMRWRAPREGPENHLREATAP